VGVHAMPLTSGPSHIEATLPEPLPQLPMVLAPAWSSLRSPTANPHSCTHNLPTAYLLECSRNRYIIGLTATVKTHTAWRAYVY
jgi:hypothetical protein